MKFSLPLAIVAGLLWWLVFSLMYGDFSDPYFIGTAVFVSALWVGRWHFNDLRRFANRNAKPS